MKTLSIKERAAKYFRKPAENENSLQETQRLLENVVILYGTLKGCAMEEAIHNKSPAWIQADEIIELLEQALEMEEGDHGRD